MNSLNSIFSLAVAVVLASLFAAETAGAQEEYSVATQDVAGTQDSPLLKRYEGSVILSQYTKKYDEFVFPTSAMTTPNHPNTPVELKESVSKEGPYTRLVYLAPEDRSPLETIRNYQDEVRVLGGNTLFECKETTCGGNPLQNSASEQGLASKLFPESKITDAKGSPGWCAMTQPISNLRYAVAELPSEGATLSVLTYQISKTRFANCAPYVDRTIAIVDLVEGEARENNMVVVEAAEMLSQIETQGSISLYGIYFDTDKTEIKAESGPTLKEVASLLKDDASLKLVVVGHTDNQGAFDYNIDLSNRRAESVVEALVKDYGVDAKNLSAHGVGSTSPVASNASDEGRAKNRRVVLVEQ